MHRHGHGRKRLCGDSGTPSCDRARVGEHTGEAELSPAHHPSVCPGLTLITIHGLPSWQRKVVLGVCPTVQGALGGISYPVTKLIAEVLRSVAVEGRAQMCKQNPSSECAPTATLAPPRSDTDGLGQVQAAVSVTRGHGPFCHRCTVCVWKGGDELHLCFPLGDGTGHLWETASASERGCSECQGQGLLKTTGEGPAQHGARSRGTVHTDGLVTGPGGHSHP